jgi:CRP-like cAMP-binding protein
MGFINSGSFRIYYLADDKEINTHFSFENEFVVDYDSFLQQKPSRYFIQALEDSEIVTFSLKTLQDAYNSSANWQRFGRMMAEHAYMATTKRVESFLFMDGEQRYRHLIETEPHIFDRVPLYHIASYIGLERESLSRLRKKIASSGRM